MAQPLLCLNQSLSNFCICYFWHKESDPRRGLFFKYANIPKKYLFWKSLCEMLVKLKVTIQMRSIIIALGDRLSKYLLGTVGLHGTCRGPEGIN